MLNITPTYWNKSTNGTPAPGLLQKCPLWANLDCASCAQGQVFPNEHTWSARILACHFCQQDKAYSKCLSLMSCSWAPRHDLCSCTSASLHVARSAFHSLFTRQDAHGNIVCQWQLQIDCEPRWWHVYLQSCEDWNPAGNPNTSRTKLNRHSPQPLAISFLFFLSRRNSRGQLKAFHHP